MTYDIGRGGRYLRVFETLGAGFDERRVEKHGRVVALFGFALHGGHHLLVPVVLLCAGLNLVTAGSVIFVTLVIVGVPRVVKVIVKETVFATFAPGFLVLALFPIALLLFAQGLQTGFKIQVTKKRKPCLIYHSWNCIRLNWKKNRSEKREERSSLFPVLTSIFLERVGAARIKTFQSHF